MTNNQSPATTNHIRVKENTPLTPLNKLFPAGVPVVGDQPTLRITRSELEAWELDLTDLDKPMLDKLLWIVNSDTMPMPIVFTAMSAGIIVIPVEWAECD